jgi:ribosome recycling factor
LTGFAGHNPGKSCFRPAHIFSGSSFTLFSSIFYSFRVSLAYYYPFQEANVIKDILKEAEGRMHAAIQNLDDDLAGIRTGRATPALVERLSVEYYGTPTSLMQLATITVPEPRSLLIKPFDPSSLKGIERAILISDLGLTPNNDGKQIRLNLPALTEERRRELVKIVHHRLEECRVAVRNVRRDLHNDMRDFEKEKLISEDDLKRGEEDLQKTTDHWIEEINKHGLKKELEIMEV